METLDSRPELDSAYRGLHRRINLTRTLPRPNQYTLALDNEYSHRAFNEERAPLNKGQWRKNIFQAEAGCPMDLEIGTGTGTFFTHLALKNPDRLLVGMELKYKPLIQSIRRALVGGAQNAAICRFHAFNLEELFTEGELNDIYIFFPDPWVTPRKPKNRTVNAELLKVMHRLQKPGSRIIFKTDSREYFLWSLDEIKNTPYHLEYQTLNLHQSDKASQNFVTGFEKIFISQGIEINYLELRK